jgi:hypothetical protein
MTDQNKTPAEPSAPALSVVAGSDIWTPERIHWLKEQLKCEYMKGPWVVEEHWDDPLFPDIIRVVYRTPAITIRIAEWAMRGVRRWSPAYYLARAHAEILARAPLYHPNTKTCHGPEAKP